MANNNGNRNSEEISKMFWSQIIIVLALLVVFIGLAGISVVSLSQTEQAFQPLNDSNVIVFGFAIGNYISILFAVVTQYTQNAALYIKKYFCKNNVVLNIGEWEFRDSQIADFAFCISALVDGLTNVIWFYRTVAIPEDMILGWMLRIVGYSAMVGSVFAEEVMGIILDALRKSLKQLGDIRKQEKRMKAREANENNNEQNPNRDNNRQSEKERGNQERGRPPFAPEKMRPSEIFRSNRHDNRQQRPDMSDPRYMPDPQNFSGRNNKGERYES